MEKFSGKAKFLFRLCIPALVVFLVTVIFLLFIKFLLPFFLAALIAMMINPLVRQLQKWGLKKGLAVAVSLVLFYSITTTLIILALIKISQELLAITTKLPAFVEHINSIIPSMLQMGERYYRVIPDEAVPYMQQGLQQLASVGISLAQQAGTWIISLFALMPLIVIVLIFTIIASFFIAKEKDAIISWFFGLFSPPTQVKIKQVGSELISASYKYLKAQFILISLTFIVTFLGLAIIRVDYVVLGSILVAIFDVIPILGPGGIFLPWAAYLLLTDNVSKGIMMLVLYAVIFLTRQFLQPKILADTMDLPTLPLLVLIYLGLTLFGVLGLIFAPFILVFYQATKRVISTK